MNDPMSIRAAAVTAITLRHIEFGYPESAKNKEAQLCFNDDAPGFRKP
jgi:hypothetical protein